jgi:hypothetical protein
MACPRPSPKSSFSQSTIVAAGALLISNYPAAIVVAVVIVAVQLVFLATLHS